jgi:ParB family chromosome partitioning protein
MGKLDDMRREAGANVGESMGANRQPGPAMHGASPGAGVPARLKGVAKSRDVAEVSIDRIIPDPDQPREEFDQEALSRLADSLRSKGQLQPIRVRWNETADRYVILCGERRWRAATMAGLATLSCVISDGLMTAGERLAVQLVENALREDLRPIEQARAYRALIDLNGWTVTDASRELAIHQSGISRALALLDLPAEVQEMVEHGGLSPATAYEVSKLPEAEDRAIVAQAAVEQRLTRGEVGDLVKAVRAKRPAPIPRLEPVTIDLGDGTVTVKWRKGSGATIVQLLRKALKSIQDRERSEEQAA